jgi:methionyl-tRNA formyltransferase
MRYIFFGTPEFAAIILKKLIEAGFIPEAVVCNPDKPVGRKKIITPPPVKQLITNLKIQSAIFQPENLSDIKSQLSKINCQIFMVAAYAQIIPKEILEIPILGTIGVHPSLLPKYRGPTPIQTAILNGEEKTGVTLFLMDEKMDHGPIISNEKLVMSNEETTKTLTNKLAELGAELLIDFLKEHGNAQKDEKINGVAQDESQATYTKKFSTEDAYLEPLNLEKAQNEGGEIAIQISRKIRALNPEPGTWTIKNGKRVKILEAKLINGKLKITKIQTEGKKPQII